MAFDDLRSRIHSRDLVPSKVTWQIAFRTEQI